MPRRENFWDRALNLAGLERRSVLSQSVREIRSSLENPQTPLSYPAEWLLDIFNGGRTDSGIRISEMTALQVSTVLACVNIVSNGIASLPLHVYERTQEGGRRGKQLAYDHSLFDLLAHEPNPEMSSPVFRKTLSAHACLWGNAYAEIERSKIDASIKAVWPRNPARTRPVRLTKPAKIEGDILPTGTLVYETNETMGDSPVHFTDSLDEANPTRRIVLAEDMLHIPGLSLDGRLGQGTVYLTRQVMGLALATEKYGAKFFGNGARPAGILIAPGTLDDVALENARRSWMEAYGGENTHRTAILDPGYKYERLASTPNEGQFLETRKYQRNEIASIFNVPPHMVGDLEKSARSNIEQSAIEFVLFCLNPWLTVFEAEYKRKLFPKQGRSANRYFPLHDTRRLLYPDADSRAKFYQAGKQWGFLNTNDIREMENLNPVTDGSGETFWMPFNMQDAQLLAKQSAHAQKALKAGDQEAVLPGMQKVLPEGTEGQQPTPAAGTQKQLPAPKDKGKKRADEASALYGVRHGQTELNKDDKYRGWSNIGLDETGQGQAKKAGAFLKDKGVTRIYSSDLQRARETAAIIAVELGITNIEFIPALRTWNVGDFTGKSKADYGDKMKHYLDNPDEVVPGGESLSEFRERSRAAITRINDTNTDEGNTAIIASLSNFASMDKETSRDLHSKVELIQPGGVVQINVAEQVVTPVFGKSRKGNHAASS